MPRAEPKRRPLFLSPHYDDAALSCGGTIATLAAAGEAPLIVTCFGGRPTGPLSDYAREMHEWWGVDIDDAIAARREEESCAAAALTAEALWLEIPEAIYRDARYTSDAQLFGPVHSAEVDLADDLERALERLLADLDAAPGRVYVPLAVGNHVDHQHTLALGLRLARSGLEVLAYEDFPYAGDPGGIEKVHARALAVSGQEPVIQRLSEDALERRVEAVLCYASQLHVIFRHQGDPEDSTRRYAREVGAGRPAERFWPLGP